MEDTNEDEGTKTTVIEIKPPLLGRQTWKFKKTLELTFQSPFFP